MPVFEINRRRILFIHIPKNAGTSVSEYLGRHSPKRFDMPMQVYGRRLRPRHLHGAALEQIFFAGMFDYAFMVVRHPLSRILSEYSYQRKQAGFHWQNFVGFDRWLDYSLWRRARDPWFRENHFRPQAEFECFDCQTFRIEDGLDRIISRLSEVTGTRLDGGFKRDNVSAKTQVAPSERSLVRIVETYRGDFERYGYGMPG